MKMARSILYAFAPVLVLAAVFSHGASAQPGAYNGYFPGYVQTSTAAQGAAYGRSAVIRSQGQYVLDATQAASQFQTARSQEIDNRYKSTQAYFDLKRINAENRAALRGPRPTEEQLVRWAQAGAPQSLSDSQVNASTGAIDWPIALMLDDMAAQRKIVQSIYSERARVGTITPQQLITSQQTIDSMIAILKDHIKDFDPNTYLAGKNFLESLGYELKQ
jgi:hypothetical protein